MHETFSHLEQVRATTTASRRLQVFATLIVISTPLSPIVLHAQALPSLNKFEVASIRPSNSPTESNRLGPTSRGGLHAENVTASQLIAFAYDLRPFQVVGDPAWVQSERFNIEAIPDQAEQHLVSETTPRDLPPMLDRLRQRVKFLLAERFGLVVRADKKELPVYALVVARGGHKLKPSQSDTPLHMESNPARIQATSADMGVFTRSLAQALQRPVVDRTELTGLYDLKLDWAPDPLAGEVSTDSSGPSIFTAIQEQLGLKLESTRAPVDVVVVVKIDKPSEN